MNDGRGEKMVCGCAIIGDDVATESYCFVDVEALGAVCGKTGLVISVVGCL